MTATAHPARRRRGRTGGFLLTETLASFTLSAFVLIGLVSGASVLLRAVDRSAAQVQESDDLVRTLDALGRDVADIRRARWFGTEPQPFVFRGGPNSLFFVEGRRGAERVVALREILVGDAPVLMRSEAALPTEARSFADLQFGVARPVTTGAARLHFYYAPAPRSGVPTPARVNSWPSGTTLPAAVIVEAVNAATGALIVSDRLQLGANGDIGCVVSRGTGASAGEPGRGGASGATANDGAANGGAANGGAANGGAANGGAGAGGAVWPPPSGLDALSQSAGTGGGLVPATTGGGATTPQAAREPEPDFCGRADKDDKPDGSGPRPQREQVASP